MSEKVKTPTTLSVEKRERPAWTSEPIPCEDCGHLLEYDFWRPGPSPSVCRRCQNKRYEARTRGTPEDDRRRKRRTLLAKLRRVEARIERDQLTLAQVREELKATVRSQPLPEADNTAREIFPQPRPSDSIRRNTSSVANLA